MNERRIKRLEIDPELFKEFFVEGMTWRCVNSELPKDTVFKGLAQDNSRNTWIMFLYHPSFPIVGEGQSCPAITPPALERIVMRNSVYEVIKG